ncbi:type IX secretion system membrane protein PorP/SprF [Pontibacter silvestris]|uniref:Type IX secretion system membrane protein PorP/SprF n=1 Tax=Pontibacter silvestris TaxID=2305183 RepID=A0ABW4WZB0_9BACT|nr:type IX secretion system membrane protein PorP/SprF [Pontibacter silvestris]MCC9138454.1 type IX secretion system membrane protein PorP/SprF [Pontibacter silvestris]
MKRFLLSAIVFLTALGAVMAQQRPQYTQYPLNNYIINPAVGGIEDYADLRMGYRAQWVGIEGAPRSFYASVHAPIGKYNVARATGKESLNRYGFSSIDKYKKAKPHHGVGAMAQVDKAGLLQTSTLNLSYAYHLPLNKYLMLSSGIYGGFTQFKANTEEAIAFDPNDPYLAGNIMNSSNLDLGVGFWLYSPDFYIGVSGAQLAGKNRDFIQNEETVEPYNRQQPHLYTTAGLRLQLTRDLSFTPSVMVKATQSASPSIDVNTKVTYNQQLWGGVSYRHKDAVAVMAGININYLLDVGYTYDVTTSGLNKATRGSHEVVVGIKLGNKDKVICPQWLW